MAASQEPHDVVDECPSSVQMERVFGGTHDAAGHPLVNGGEVFVVGGREAYLASISSSRYLQRSDQRRTDTRVRSRTGQYRKQQIGCVTRCPQRDIIMA